MRWFIIFVVILIRIKTEIVASDTKDDLSKVYEHIAEYKKNFTIRENHNYTILLGTTGCGKSTLIKLLTDKNLKSKKIRLGEYIFSDDNVTIGELTTVSKTILPEVTEDNVTGINFVDSPGFEDTRGVLLDIGTTYFINKLLKITHSINLVLVVNAWSVKPEGGQRNEFLTFITQVSKLIKKPEKYQNAIVLIVSKVENLRDEDDQLVPDTELIKSVETFLNDTLNVIMEKKEMISEMVIIRAILENKRIAMIRKPRKAGLVREMPTFQNESANIIKIINQMALVRTSESDFNHTLPEKSINLVREEINNINNDLIVNVSSVANEIKQFNLKPYNKKQFYQHLFLSYSKLKNIDATNNKTYIKEFILSANSLLSSSYSSEEIMNKIDFVEFLELISNSKVKNPIQMTIVTEIKDLIQFLEEKKSGMPVDVQLIDNNIINNISLLVNNIEQFYANDTKKSINLLHFYQDIFSAYRAFIRINKAEDENTILYVENFLLTTKNLTFDISDADQKKLLGDIELREVLRSLDSTNVPP